MNHYTWTDEFRKCWNKTLAAYHSGNRQPSSLFSEAESAFLAGIGCSAQEIYDFAEDWCDGKEPTFETSLLITAARRDYFMVVQKGQPSTKTVSMSDLPSKDAAVGGFAWLPRIIPKARAKLRGEMPADLMYGCGGDRAFCQRTNIHLADFLRVVWSAGDDDQQVIEYVKQCANSAR